MDLLQQIINAINAPLTPILVVTLLGTGLFLTIRLGFPQFRRLAHGFAVTTGRYDDPNEPGDVSHFQALTTALSATVGVGNIAGVAMAIHIGGPGALFWMWITAILGMATKYAEVTLAQHYREITGPDLDPKKWEGSVSGGPMYYIEKGLGWKPVAVFFAFALMITSFMTGNAVQANTIATQMFNQFGVETWITGLVTASLVGAVILGGISRIGRVTSIIAPLMAAIYVVGALLILILNIDAVPGAFATIFTEAFNPTAGVAGTGIGLFLTTLTYGVQRGLFSNEAGQGSAPIAHSAAKTDEPVSEGVVALLEPFIDTIIICSLTGLVVVATGVFTARVDTTVPLDNANVSYVVENADGGYEAVAERPGMLTFTNGLSSDAVHIAWLGVGIDTLYTDADQTQPFTGTLFPRADRAEDEDGSAHLTLYGPAIRNSAPLTTLAFEQGLAPVGLGTLGRYIVLVSVFLFALSTSISWSYYGDRCANYLFGPRGILPYKAVFLLMHFVGATLAVTAIWDIGDVALALVTLPNVVALIVLSGTLKKLTDSYFERRPWEENEVVHKQIVAEEKARKTKPKQL